jgi:hypothetical protein
MIVGSCFNGDSNETLMLIQHDLYFPLLGLLVQYSKERYLNAIRLIGVKTELAKLVEQIKRFDHRVLQNAHDRIAAYYRFAHDNRGQMPLPFDNKTYEDFLIEEWSTFFTEEAQKLTESDPIVIAILTAVAYENTQKGYAAEKHLLTLLDMRYEDFLVEEHEDISD